MTRLFWRLALALAALALTLTATLAFFPRAAATAEAAGTRSADWPVVPGALPAHRDQPFPGPGADQRQGTVQLPSRLGRAALFVATETAKKIGLKPAKNAFWTPIDRLDFEGGAELKGVKARVEDPFQLVGMNALGLPGASIDGILGFTILARYRLEIDPTKDRMTWTRLDYEPRDPPVPDRKPGDDARRRLEMQAMNALGPIAKGLAFLMGKQPEEERHPRGFLGLEWSEQVEAGQTSASSRRRLERLACRRPAGFKPAIGSFASRIARSRTRPARAALAEVRPGDTVPLVVRRGSGADARESA